MSASGSNLAPPILGCVSQVSQRSDAAIERECALNQMRLAILQRAYPHLVSSRH
jgi:hypothetical protein